VFRHDLGEAVGRLRPRRQPRALLLERRRLEDVRTEPDLGGDLAGDLDAVAGHHLHRQAELGRLGDRRRRVVSRWIVQG
jgi:hypothetical protein